MAETLFHLNLLDLTEAHLSALRTLVDKEADIFASFDLPSTAYYLLLKVRAPLTSGKELSELYNDKKSLSHIELTAEQYRVLCLKLGERSLQGAALNKDSAWNQVQTFLRTRQTSV